MVLGLDGCPDILPLVFAVCVVPASVAAAAAAILDGLQIFLLLFFSFSDTL